MEDRRHRRRQRNQASILLIFHPTFGAVAAVKLESPLVFGARGFKSGLLGLGAALGGAGSRSSRVRVSMLSSLGASFAVNTRFVKFIRTAFDKDS